MSSPAFVMDAFAMRQFNNPLYTGTQIKYDVSDFEKKINKLYDLGNTTLKDGYAPFCKHLFVENFADVTCGCTFIKASLCYGDEDASSH